MITEIEVACMNAFAGCQVVHWSPEEAIRIETLGIGVEPLVIVDSPIQLSLVPTSIIKHLPVIQGNRRACRDEVIPVNNVALVTVSHLQGGPHREVNLPL